MKEIKILPFSEFYNLVHETSDYSVLEPYEKLLGIPYNQYDNIGELIQRLVYEYYNFVSQPFKPELIEELFEGWEFNNDTNIHHVNKNLIELDYFNQKLKYNGMFWYVPRTLDRFICNCQDAGIELEWRKE